MAATLRVSLTARRAHRSIGSALLAASGSRRAVRVEIEPGRYAESLSIRGDVELAATGAPGSVVIGSGDGTVVEALGRVRLTGLVLDGVDGDTVRCGAGSLTVQESEIHSRRGAGLHAVAGTSVTVRDSTFRGGRAVFAGSVGLIERCRFAAATNNAVAAIEGADLRVQDSWIGHSRIHGVLVQGSRAVVSGCELTGTGNSAIAADGQGELVVTGCRITDVHASGVSFAEQARGLVEDTRVSDAEHGIAVVSGADPVVRRCVFTGCRDTGINVNSQGLGRFEDCEVTAAGNVAVFATTGGSPQVDGCRIADGNVGIAVVGARGWFARCDVQDLTSTALRVWQGSTAQFTGARTTRCPVGLEVRGDHGTKAEVVDTLFHEFRISAVAMLEQARVTMRNCTARDGLVGFAAADDSQLITHDCAIDGTEAGGAVVYGQAKLTAQRLTMTNPGAYGLRGQDSAYLDVRDSDLTGAQYVGVSLDDLCGGWLVNCSIAGTQGVAVVENDRVQLTGLRTTLPITRQEPEPPPELPKQIINIFHGPVFNATAYGVELHQGTDVVQPAEGTAMSDNTPAGPANSGGDRVSNTYIGPVFTEQVSNPQLAWNNNQVTQNQIHNKQVAPGFDEVARVVAAVLDRLPGLGLPDADAHEATEHGRAVLAEVVRPEPDRGVIRRGLTALKGTLAQLAAGLLTGANAGSVEVGKELVQSLGHLPF